MRDSGMRDGGMRDRGMRDGNAGRDFGVGTGIGLGIGITNEIIKSQRDNETDRSTKQGKAAKKDNKAGKKSGNDTKDATKTGQGKGEQPSTNATSENVWTDPSVWMNPATGKKVYVPAGKEGPKGPPGTSWIMVNPPKDKTVYMNPTTGDTIEVGKGEPAPKVPAGTTWIVLKWSPPSETATDESKTGGQLDPKLRDDKGGGIAGEKGGGVPPAYSTPPHINETADRDDHYFAGLSDCTQCEFRCKKQSTGQGWPDCKHGTLRNCKETLLKTLVLTDGKLYVKIEVNQEICNTVSCHSYGNSIASPAVGLKVCCTYKQWQSDSYTSWATPITDVNGLVTSYKIDTSTPCSCGQLYEAALDAQLADGTYGRTKFVGAVGAACPNLPLEGLEDFIKSCKFFGSDVKVGGVDWNNLMNTVIGHLGASKGESGPGWSYPDPPKVPKPEAKPSNPGLGGPPPK